MNAPVNDQSEHLPDSSYVSLQTLGEFLIGRRDAIGKIMDCPAAIWIGLVFVIAAGFAREYDGESLVHEPWHLLIPLGASIASSLVLYIVLYLVSICRKAPRRGFIAGYRQFLTLYWMTAPLALVYGIPFERMVSPVDAMRANLVLLGIVAAWRVILMIRVASVLYKCHWTAATCAVMLFANSLAFTAIMLMPKPILNLMGGIRLTESQDLLSGVSLMLTIVTFLSTPVWLLLTIVVSLGRVVSLQPWGNLLVEKRTAPTRGLTYSVWAVGVASVLFWLIFMPNTQMEQWHRYQLTRMLVNGEFADAVAYTNELEQSDLPPHWDPPPAIGYGEWTPNVDEFLAAAEELNPPQWLLQAYLDKKKLYGEMPAHMRPAEPSVVEPVIDEPVIDEPVIDEPSETELLDTESIEKDPVIEKTE